MTSILVLRAFLVFCSLLALVGGQDALQYGMKEQLHPRDDILPACAASCLADLARQYGCDLTDTECTCNNVNLTAAVGACVGTNCTVREALLTQRVTSNACGLPVRNKGQKCRTIMWSLLAISISFVALRFLARTKRLDGPGFGADDWTMLVVLAFMFPHEIGLEMMIQNGLGQDIWMIDPLDKLTTLLMFFWTGEMWYTFVVCLTKISILLLYLRIFPKTVASRWFRTTVWGLIGVCAAANTAFVLSIIFQCNPVVGAYKAWDGSVEAKCFNTTAQIIGMAGINIILDLMVFFLPIPKLLQLEISTQKKIGVCLTFMVGLFVTIVSIIRLVKFCQHYDTPNTTWDFVPIGNWSQFEVNVGIWCACMPSLSRLIKKFVVDVMGHKLSSYFSHGERTHGGTNPASFVKSHTSRRSRLNSGSEIELREDVEAMPKGAVAKTVEAKVVFNRRNDSSEDVESLDMYSVKNGSVLYHQHRYVKDW